MGYSCNDRRRVMSYTTVLRARTRKQQRYRPFEARRALVDGHEICARECFLFWQLFHSVDCLFCVICIWSHRYSEHLLAYSYHSRPDLNYSMPLPLFGDHLLG